MWRVKDKLGVWLRLPLKILGLFAMYLGYTLEACQRLGESIVDEFHSVTNKRLLHRVILHLFSTPVLHCQLLAFIAGDRFLHFYPELYLFVFRYAVLTLNEQWLEGRRRHIKMGGTMARSHTGPAGHSSVLRRHQTTKLCQQRDFLNWVAWQWRSKDTFEQLLWYTMKRAGTSQRGLSYVQKVAKVYGCDVDSQFQVIPEWATLLCRWGDLAKQHRANTTLPITYVQQLAIDYYKARFQVGHIYSVPMEVAELARLEETGVHTDCKQHC